MHKTTHLPKLTIWSSLEGGAGKLRVESGTTQGLDFFSETSRETTAGRMREELSRPKAAGRTRRGFGELFAGAKTQHPLNFFKSAKKREGEEPEGLLFGGTALERRSNHRPSTSLGMARKPIRYDPHRKHPSDGEFREMTEGKPCLDVGTKTTIVSKETLSVSLSREHRKQAGSILPPLSKS